MGLTLLAQSKLPLYYWLETFQIATYLINQLPTTTLQGKTPHLVLYNKEPYYKELKPFGCACYLYLRPYKQHKLSFHTVKCIFLGYSGSHKGFKCHSSMGRMYILRHVIFNELEFPFEKGFLNTSRTNYFRSHSFLAINSLDSWYWCWPLWH